jgi:hypothetical protein
MIRRFRNFSGKLGERVGAELGWGWVWERRCGEEDWKGMVMVGMGKMCVGMGKKTMKIVR